MRGVERLDRIGDRFAVRLHAEPLGGLGDAGRLMPQRLQQPLHAVGARRHAQHHRADDALAQFLGEIVEHLVARRRDVFEQLLHQLVVVVGELFQHAEARFLLAIEVLARELDHLGRRVLLVDMGALEREVDEAGDDLARPDRNLPQHQRNARRRLQDLQRLAHALVGLVDLVEEQEARDLQLFELAQDQLQLRHLALVGLADDDGGVDRRQRRAHVVHELDRARAIDEGETVAEIIGGGEGELDAHPVVARLGA